MINRRTFLVSAGLAAPGVAGAPALAAAADWTDAEKANVSVVNEMCRAWTAPINLDKIGSFLSEDCVYRATEAAPPVTGRQAIVDSLKKMLGAATKTEFEIVQTFARGPMVDNERFVRFALPPVSRQQPAFHGQNSSMTSNTTAPSVAYRRAESASPTSTSRTQRPSPTRHFM